MMNNDRTNEERPEWTEADFDKLSWHDCHVHGLGIEEAEHGTGVLTLDLDFILEWLPPHRGAFTFRVAPATLQFLDVFNLRVELDWGAVQAGIVPFSIGEIRREPRSKNGYEFYVWTIEVNWPKGSITFEGKRLRQVLRGEVTTTSSPCLAPEQRGGTA